MDRQRCMLHDKILFKWFIKSKTLTNAQKLRIHKFIFGFFVTTEKTDHSNFWSGQNKNNKKEKKKNTHTHRIQETRNGIDGISNNVKIHWNYLCHFDSFAIHSESVR